MAIDYIFLIYEDASYKAAPTPEQMAHCNREHWAVMDDAGALGKLKGVSPLTAPSSAITVRTGSSGILATDGPHAETKELVGGYYLISCDTPEEAKQWAKRIAGAHPATIVEIRALAPIPARMEPSRNAAILASV